MREYLSAIDDAARQMKRHGHALPHLRGLAPAADSSDDAPDLMAQYVAFRPLIRNLGGRMVLVDHLVGANGIANSSPRCLVYARGRPIFGRQIRAGTTRGITFVNGGGRSSLSQALNTQRGPP